MKKTCILAYLGVLGATLAGGATSSCSDSGKSTSGDGQGAEARNGNEDTDRESEQVDAGAQTATTSEEAGAESRFDQSADGGQAPSRPTDGGPKTGAVSNVDAGSNGGGVPSADSGSSSDTESNADIESNDDAEGASCREAGQYCGETDEEQCCADSTCIVDSTASIVVCAANCTDGSECQSGCCAALRNTDQGVCSPDLYCEPPPAPPTAPSSCGTLVLVAYDGTYLGIATSNSFESESVCNSFGDYGSEFSQTSIFNQFSPYGSEFQTDSAYNPVSVTPPLILCSDSGDWVAYVSKNTALSPSIDPDLLCATLNEAGL